MSTNLTLHLSSAFLQEVTGSPDGSHAAGTQGGTWVYLWNEQPPPDVGPSPLLPAGAASNFTPLVLNGALSSNVTYNATHGDYEVTIALTDSSLGQVQSSSAYLIVQSEDPGNHTDLTQSSAIGSNIGQIQPNVQAWHYGYSAFEFNLQNQSADQGDLTSIPGFAQHLAVNINYSDGTSDSRGYALSGAAITTALTNLEPAAAIAYPAPASGTPYSPLDNQTSMVISPSNGTFGSGFYPSSNWSQYLTAVGQLTDMTISGATQGETDASGIWHNGQYYSYTVSSTTLGNGAWGSAGTYFVFSPTQDSQTKGYILISESTLQDNLYAAGQGTATLWQDSGFTQPYIAPGSGLPPGTAPTSNAFNPSMNNEWGNIFTPLFTGFTAGYWGTTAQQSNPMNRGTTDNLAGGPINLDDSHNWSPSYAFDLNRTNTVPTFQHNDAYTQEFFNESNVYGSAFSDNLSNGLTPSPLISLSNPGSSANVSNIDLYAYGSGETDPYYKVPVGANYLPVAAGHDYLVPTQPSSGLQLQVIGGAAGLFVQSGVTAQLGIYQGNGQFTYVPIETGGNLWQNYNVTGGPGNWSITAGGTNVQGTFNIANLPTPATASAGDIYWYQLVLSDSAGDQKVFDFYATAAATLGQVQTAATSVAADGGATVTQAALSPTFVEVDLNPASSLPSGLLTFVYNSQHAPMPAAPIVGTLSGSTFTALDNQDGMGILSTPAPDATSASGSLAFGWTGTNNGTHTGMPTNPVFSGGTYTDGLITHYTNKINAGNVAQIGFVDTATHQPLDMVLHATADLDGQWQTTTTAQFGNGSYTATMTEYLPDGTTVFGPPSATLTLNVNIPTLTLQSTHDGSGLEFASTGGLGDGGGNWLHLDALASPSSLPQGATLMLYGTQPDGTLVARDGHTGADVGIDDATLAKIGTIQSDTGADLLSPHQTFFLPADEQLHFAILNKDGTIDAGPEVHITSQGGAFAVNAGGLGFSATVDNTITRQTYLGSEQRSTDLPVFHLTQGETLHLDVAGSAANTNTAHFVRIDVDANTGAWSVGGVAYGNTDAFRTAVQQNWDQGFALQNGHGTFHDAANWTVAGKSGFYAPVLATQGGDVFVVGTANVDGHEHIRMLGENTFGIEDLRANQHSDFDYNDMVLKLTAV